MGHVTRKGARAAAIALAAMLATAAPALAQDLSGDWILESGQARFPVLIEQSGESVTLTIRETNRGDDVMTGVFRDGRLQVSRDADRNDMRPGATPECRALLLERVAQLRAQSAFRRSVDATLQTVDGAQVLQGTYTLQPELRCTPDGGVQTLTPGVISILLRPELPPFELQFTTLQDGTFVVVDEAMIGGSDIYVEAKFERSPSQDSFEVTLGWEGGAGASVRVTRTDEDPLLFRSAPLRIRGSR